METALRSLNLELLDAKHITLKTASREHISGITNRVVCDHNGGVDGVSNIATASSAEK